MSGALLLDLLKQLKVHRNVAAQQLYLGISLFEQASKSTRQLCTFSNKGCKSLVLICEISVGNGVTAAR